MKKNITNKILMVRPISFAFNEQTAVNNHYQKLDNKPAQEIQNIDSAIDISNSKLQEYNKQLKKFTNQADAIDYTVAISSGILAGIIDSFFVGDFSLSEGKAWSNHKVNDFVMKIAKNKGYSKNRLKGAIDFLEDKFKIPSDNIWFGKNVNIWTGSHHLDDLAREEIENVVKRLKKQQELESRYEDFKKHIKEEMKKYQKLIFELTDEIKILKEEIKVLKK